MHGCTAPLIDVRSLDHHFGMRAALQGVNLVVRPGEIHGLLGPARSGKTTLLRVLAGSLRPSAGQALVPPIVAFVSADGPRDMSGIEARLDSATRRRIALARAVAGMPDVLLVDEPAEGFDADSAATTRALVLRHAARGGGTLWATRRLDELHGVAADVTLLVDGRVRYANTVDALVRRALPARFDAVAAPLHRAA
jgi:ABC-2 type transport system ATP-binding protein